MGTFVQRFRLNCWI